MSSHFLSFSKLKNLSDYYDEYEPTKISDVEDCSLILENMQRIKEKILTNLNAVIKEFSLRSLLEKELSTLGQQESSSSHKLLKLKKKLQNRKDEKQDNDAKKALRSSVLKFYEQYLSLKIEPTNGNVPVSKDESAVTFAFHNIDANNPQKTYSFVLITDGSIYKVANCQPPMKEIWKLLYTLNRTNDLQSFVKEMRKSFMNIASLST